MFLRGMVSINILQDGVKTIGNLNINCTGCGACSLNCPYDAISMYEDEEGFLYPVIDKDKCVKCSLCVNTCPLLSNKNKNQDFESNCFAVMADDNMRLGSSSGGVFPVLAHYFLDQGSFVVGAVWTSEGMVQHIVSNKKEDVEKMRGSKYLQSVTGDCYKKVEAILLRGDKVLFSGTPCQIAGLYSFLKKDYENLYTIDLICHGVPSSKVFRKYLEECLDNEEKFIEANFRDKVNGWGNNLVITIKTNKRKFSQSSLECGYMDAFLNNLCLRKSCSDCQFNKLPRQADITIGDFWGIDKFNKKYNDSRGTSVVLANNLKGQYLLKNIVEKFKLFKKVPIYYAQAGNPNLKESSKHHENREVFYKLLNTFTFKKALKKAKEIKYDGVILNFCFSKNYGAALTAYCLQQYLKLHFKKDFKLINWKDEYSAKNFPNSFCEKFAEEKLSLTKEFKNIEDLKELNSLTEIFIVGSDQVFRYNYVKNSEDAYFLNFTDFTKKRIAFSASFGTDKFEANQYDTYRIQKFLKRFDAISTREDSGVTICAEEFGISAKHILDPVFLIERKNIEDLINSNNDKYKNKIVTYILDKKPKIEQKICALSQKVKKEILGIAENVSLEEWLEAIYNCEYLITDSFHGACCAIIFHKKFLCLKNKNRGEARFNSLEKTFDLKGSFVSDINDLQYFEDFHCSIDWEIVEKVLLKEREKAFEWIKSALESEKMLDNEKIANELDSKNFVKREIYYPWVKKKSFFENIFSVRNEMGENKKHKVIKFLGIKFKIKFN